MIKIKTKALKINQKKLFWLSLFSILFLVSFYFFSLSMTVFNTVERSKIEKELAFMRNKIGELEFTIISEKNNINLDLAHSFGFEEVDEVKFISRKSVATIINTNNI